MKVDEIDWQNKPAGATHWEPESYDYAEGWMKLEGDVWYFWCTDHNVWEDDCNVTSSRVNTFIPVTKSSDWNGEGLPPVGCRCMFTEYGDDMVGVIVAHVKRDGMIEAIIQLDNDDWFPGEEESFKPITTPAELKVEQAIDMIMDDLNLPSDCRYIAERVYERGYSKDNQ